MAGTLRSVPCPALGRAVALPERPERIVSLAPSLTDTVVRLRGLEALAGRSAWCRRPAEVERLPVAGSYTECRRDRLEAMDADLVLATGGVQEPLARELAEEGWPVYLVPLPTSPWGILENVTVLGTVTGAPDAALELARRCHASLAALEQALPRLATWVEIDLGEPVTPGLGSYITWTLAWIGLEPAGWNDARAYAAVHPGSGEVPPPDLVLYDPEPSRRPPADAVRAHLRAAMGEAWVRTVPIVVTEGDVLAHSGPWLLLDALPAPVTMIRETLR